MSAQAIADARTAYLASNPLNLHAKAAPTLDSSGSPAGVLTFPDLAQVQLLAGKLGIEYLAICNDPEEVESWIDTVLSLGQTPDATMLLLINVFRGIDEIAASLVGGGEGRRIMERLAVDAWGWTEGGQA